MSKFIIKIMELSVFTATLYAFLCGVFFAMSYGWYGAKNMQTVAYEMLLLEKYDSYIRNTPSQSSGVDGGQT